MYHVIVCCLTFINESSFFVNHSLGLRVIVILETSTTKVFQGFYLSYLTMSILYSSCNDGNLKISGSWWHAPDQLLRADLPKLQSSRKSYKRSGQIQLLQVQTELYDPNSNYFTPIPPHTAAHGLNSTQILVKS